MRFREASKKVKQDFNKLLDPKCEDGIHCPVQDDMQRWPYEPPAGVTDHNLLTGVTFAQHHAHYAYELPPFAVEVFGLQRAGGFNPPAGRCYIHAIQVHFLCTCSGIVAFYEGVGAGNFRAAIYGPDTATPPATPGNPLRAQSGSIAVSGINRATFAPFAVGNVQFQPGLYWLANQGDNDLDTWTWTSGADTTVMKTGDHFDFAGSFFDNPGGYGVFPDPLPAVAAHVYAPLLLLRVVSMP